MPQRPILRTAKYSNLGGNIGKQQRLQWSTFVEGAIPKDDRVHYSHSLNRPREARDMDPGAYLWLPDPYQYEPLQNDYRAIRLIEVLPGPEDSIIKCAMHQAMLDSKYTCISYLSSLSNEPDDSENFFISVDKKRLQVSKGLWSFLHFARSRQITDRLWIDEICVNLQDLEEKSQQISLTQWIHRSANDTIAWLENPNLTSTGAPDLSILEYASTQAQEDEELDSTWLSSHISAIQTFLFLPYWWRLWSAQEIILSPNPRFITFTHESTLPAIYALFSTLTKSKYLVPDLYHAMLCSPVFILLSNVRKAFLKHEHVGRLPLHYLTQALKFNDCTDPRDRIYAVLGLVTHGDMFEVDYREPVADLLRRAWEVFHPKKRSMAKLLFADLLETMDADPAALPFYLASKRMYSPVASEALRINEPFSTERSRLEITEKQDWNGREAALRTHGGNGSVEISQLCSSAALLACRRRSRCCAARRGRAKHGIHQLDAPPSCRLITCWQV